VRTFAAAQTRPGLTIEADRSPIASRRGGEGLVVLGGGVGRRGARLSGFIQARIRTETSTLCEITPGGTDQQLSWRVVDFIHRFDGGWIIRLRMTCCKLNSVAQDEGQLFAGAGPSDTPLSALRCAARAMTSGMVSLKTSTRSFRDGFLYEGGSRYVPIRDAG